MTKYIEKIHNIETNEVIEREYTPEEIAIVEAELIQSKAISDAEAVKAEAKAALLEKLGISEDEAKLLLG